MSVSEEVGKVAHGFMDVMRTQPLALALCIISFALVGFVYYQSSVFNAQRVDNVKLFVDMQKEVQKLLSQCIIPGGPAAPRSEQLLPDADIIQKTGN